MRPLHNGLVRLVAGRFGQAAPCHVQLGGDAGGRNGAVIHWQLQQVQSFQAFRRDLREFLERHGVSGGLCDDLTLVTQEACNNACRCCADGDEVDVSVCRVEGTIVIEVADRGCGFDLAAIRAGWPPQLLRGDGRGLFLMSELTDQVEIVARRPGTLVRMFKAVT